MDSFVYVVRTHEDHWDNDVVVAKFSSLYEAFEFIQTGFSFGITDCYSIEKEILKK